MRHRGASPARRGAVAVVSAVVAVGVSGARAGANTVLSAVDQAAPAVEVGQWTAPFEEGGASTPRCVPDPTDVKGFVVCKPVAQAAAVLPDGRVFYYNALEGQENASGPSAFSLSPSSRNSQARVLDLRSGTPRWTVPSPERGAVRNPNVRPGHQSLDYPPGAAGVPGRPGDGFVGSTAGALGVPPHEPTSSPDYGSRWDGDMFCADLMTLPDGRVLIAGGTGWYNEPAVAERNRGDAADIGLVELEGLRITNIFDPATNGFTAGGHMKYGRWYPSLTELPDGRALVVSGVTKLVKSTQLSQVRRTETYDPVTNRWAENYVGPESENSLPLVARTVLAPNGKVFYAGVGQMWGTFGQAIDEALFALQQYFDPATKKWEIAGVAPVGARDSAFVVPLTLKAPYDTMTLLTFGGTLGPPPGSYVALPISTLTTLRADGTVSDAMTGNLNHSRWFASGVLLPDGTVMAVAGADKNEVINPGIEIPVRTPEIYNPETGRWTDVADHSRDRTYHNSALLLPDMRVLLGGHSPLGANYGGANKDQGRPFASNDKDPSFEVYSPPYLFRGPRPSISHAPAGLAWGSTFTVTTPQADDIESVRLLRLPAPQHVQDSRQRALDLPFTRAGGDRLTVTAPPTGIAAPPGHYYLVVNKRTPDGPVPSVARIVKVGAAADDAEAFQPYPDNPPAPQGGDATPDPDTSDQTFQLADASRGRRTNGTTRRTTADGPAQLPDHRVLGPGRFDPAGGRLARPRSSGGGEAPSGRRVVERLQDRRDPGQRAQIRLRRDR
ncbi:MAG: galactose oxidase early set domain-containing protein [Actinomycetota bacterium]|jgi:hypothetical protein